MSCQYSLFSAVALVDVLCPGPTSCHPLLRLGTPSPAVPGAQTSLAPLAFPLLSLRSDSSPVPVPSRSSWRCPGGGQRCPWGHWHWEPGSSVPAGRTQSQAPRGQGRRGAGSTPGVPIPALPMAGQGRAWLSRSRALLQGWAAPCPGLCPAGLGPCPSPHTQRPHGSFRELLLAPGTPCPSPPVL